MRKCFLPSSDWVPNKPSLKAAYREKWYGIPQPKDPLKEPPSYITVASLPVTNINQPIHDHSKRPPPIGFHVDIEDIAEFQEL